jgi:hypothetical protein
MCVCFFLAIKKPINDDNDEMMLIFFHDEKREISRIDLVMMREREGE